MAQLERAHVRDDPPPVLDGNLRLVVRHRAEAVRDDLEEIPRRRLTQPVDVVVGGLLEAALHDHAVAFARSAVARRAVDVEALLSAIEIRARDRERKERRDLAVDAAGIEELIVVEMAAR